MLLQEKKQPLDSLVNYFPTSVDPQVFYALLTYYKMDYTVYSATQCVKTEESSWYSYKCAKKYFESKYGILLRKIHAEFLDLTPTLNPGKSE